ncbi:MAG: HDOD domain-containing protein, partial [Lentisphaerae bacterium]|nr:HDOD domain-containing protein [Lentisphaerota bacterium]
MSSRDEILAKVHSVPALPMAATKVISLLQDPDVGVSEVMKVIEFDPGLTSNVLRLANSAYFGGNREIVSLRDAGVRLGTNQVFQMVMTSSVSQVAAQPVRGYSLPAGELLEHSIAVAIGAEQLAEALGRKPPGHTFTTGLLHDLGKIVLGTFVEVDVAPILEMAFQNQVSFEVAEQHVLGI